MTARLPNPNPFSIAFWLFLLAMFCCSTRAHAQAGICQPGKHCLVESVTARPQPLTSFGTCTPSQMYGRVKFDGDAGVLRVCQRDGGWEAVASAGSSSSGDSFWADAGAGYIFAREALKNPDGGVVTIVGSAAVSSLASMKPALALAYDSTISGFNMGPSITWLAAPGSAVAYGFAFSSNNTSTNYVQGLNLQGNSNIGFFSGSVAGSGTKLGSWSSSGLLTTEVALKIGSTGATINGSYEGVFAADGGALAAHTCEDQAVVSAATGCQANAQCSVGRPQGQPSGLVADCWISDVSAATYQLCNVTASAIGKKASNLYTIRCFNR